MMEATAAIAAISSKLGGGEAGKGGEHAPPSATARCVRYFAARSAGEISTLNCWHQMITL